MMTGLVAVAVLGRIQQDPEKPNMAQGRTSMGILLPNPNGPKNRSRLLVYQDRLPYSKLTPRKMGTDGIQWEFDFNVVGQGSPRPEDPPMSRFSVYSQERKTKGDLAPMVGRMLLRLWEHNFDAYKLDHSPTYKFGVVDVYLCFGGKAGGEQMFDVDSQYKLENGSSRPVNTIYIYDLASFKNPIEMAREVAHEYGHASLPAVGGFKIPEDWANGYLGERLFLVWLRDELAAGRLTTDDTMGATLMDLNDWIRANVDAFVLKGGLLGPSLLSNQKEPAKMDAYLSLMMAQSALIPAPAFGRALKLVGSSDPKDVPDSFALAVDELDAFDVTVPKVLAGKAIWLPTADRKMVGAKLLAKSGSWRKIQPTAGVIHFAKETEKATIGSASNYVPNRRRREPK